MYLLFSSTVFSLNVFPSRRIRCIPASAYCDLSPDCADGSDEPAADCPDAYPTRGASDCRQDHHTFIIIN